MKKFTLMLSFILGIVSLQAQDYLISFEGSNLEVITGVTVKNLTLETEVILGQGEVLRLLRNTTGVAQVINQNSGLQVYPNPMTETSSIEFNASVSGLASISVFDATGKQVISEQLNLAVGSHVFKLNNLSTGIYTLSVKSDSYLYSAKLVSQSKTTGYASLSYISKNALKSGKSTKGASEISLAYTDGDHLLITATSGTMSTVKSIVPTATTTEIFNFIACTDGDGNHYPIVTIGAQVWMAKNLNTTKYSDGTAIPFYSKEQNPEFGALSNNDADKGFGYYDVAGNEAGEIYGALYTYAAAINGDNSGTNVQGVCPTGWHLPSDNEWTILTDELGGTSIAGVKLKEAGNTHWTFYNSIVATNSSGFTALPGGYRSNNSGIFSSRSICSTFWSATENSAAGAWYRYLGYNYSIVGRDYIGKSYGNSVRCVRD